MIISCFNEARTIETVLRKVLQQPEVKEIIVVDDDSADATAGELARWAREPRVQVFRHDRNRGKEAAVRTGLEHVTASIVLIQDADLEYDPCDYKHLVRPILDGEADVVYGSRFLTGTACSSHWNKLTNFCLTRYSNLLTGQALTDEATCYKVFRSDTLIGLNLEENGFNFCAEVTAKLGRFGVSIKEVPIDYRPRTRAQGKKLRFRHGVQALWCLLKYSKLRPAIPTRAFPAAAKVT